MMKLLDFILLLAGIMVGMLIGSMCISYSPSCQMQEYQIRIESDSAFIYDKGRLVGSCKHGIDGIDSVILKDNQ